MFCGRGWHRSRRIVRSIRFSGRRFVAFRGQFVPRGRKKEGCRRSEQDDDTRYSEPASDATAAGGRLLGASVLLRLRRRALPVGVGKGVPCSRSGVEYGHEGTFRISLPKMWRDAENGPAHLPGGPVSGYERVLMANALLFGAALSRQSGDKGDCLVLPPYGRNGRQGALFASRRRTLPRGRAHFVRSENVRENGSLGLEQQIRDGCKGDSAVEAASFSASCARQRMPTGTYVRRLPRRVDETSSAVPHVVPQGLNEVRSARAHNTEFSDSTGQASRTAPLWGGSLPAGVMEHRSVRKGAATQHDPALLSEGTEFRSVLCDRAQRLAARRVLGGVDEIAQRQFPGRNIGFG